MAASMAYAIANGMTRRRLRLALARKSRLFSPRVIVAGDSLAACCDFRPLARRPFGVLSVAKGGATLREIAGQLSLTKGIKARSTIVDGGLNDLLAHEASPEQIARDFRLLASQLARGGEAIFTLMPHVADRAHADRIDEANALIAAICRENGVAVIDLNPRVSVDGVRKAEMTDDGLHFTPGANALWIDALRKVVSDYPCRPARGCDAR